MATYVDKVKIQNAEETQTVSITQDGSKHRLDCDIKGSVSIIGQTTGYPIQIQYNKAFSAINANEWQELAVYTIPMGYRFSVLSFRCNSETAGEKAKVFVDIEAGQFDCPTNTFTDGGFFAAPQFGSGLYLYVTTLIGSATNDIVTITYTNELGITGRTCTITIPKSSPIGTAIEGILQDGDIGITDVTNVTHSATGQAGAFHIELYYNVFNLLMSSANVQYQAVSISGNPATFDEGTELRLAVLAGTKTSYIRQLSMFGTLDPK